jgi:hypothetical protein
MKKIKLTQDKFALVDDQDYEFLIQWKWCASKHRGMFYAVRCVQSKLKQTAIKMHQIIAIRMGLLASDTLDHIDQNGLNNQRLNLRLATVSQNGINRPKQRNNTSGYKGVHWRKDSHKWQAKIQINGKDIHLGYFTSKKEAAKAYNKAALKYFGKFAVLNKV